jgi:hypothetical protein
MKVLCNINNIFDLKDSSTVERVKKYINYSDGRLNIEKNKEYFVYGIDFRDNSPWYYLCVDYDDEYPKGYPAELFDITDSRLSLYWKLSTVTYPGEVMSSLVFDEWAKDYSFLERLIDGDPAAVSLFAHYRELMDKE